MSTEDSMVMCSKCGKIYDIALGGCIECMMNDLYNFNFGYPHYYTSKTQALTETIADKEAEIKRLKQVLSDIKLHFRHGNYHIVTKLLLEVK